MHPVLFSMGRFDVRTTAAVSALSALAAFLYMRRERARAGLSLEAVWSLTLWLVPACFIGAIAMDAIFFGWRTQSGLFYGSFWASLLATWLFCEERELAFAPAADLLAEAATLGISIKRWGCLLNGCCFGLPTDEAWGLAFSDPASRVPQEWLGQPLHPVQFYESALCLALFAAARRLVVPRVRNGVLAPGSSFAFLTAGYALARLALSPLRYSPPGLLGSGIGTPAWLAVIALLAALTAGALLNERP